MNSQLSKEKRRLARLTAVELSAEENIMLRFVHRDAYEGEMQKLKAGESVTNYS